MRSLLILPLLASAYLQSWESETDEHVSLLQHQARKVIASEEQGPPAAQQEALCMACMRGRNGQPWGFCPTNLRCDRQIGGKCADKSVGTGVPGRTCQSLNPTGAGAGPPPPAGGGPPPAQQQRQCEVCAGRAGDQPFGFCGMTMGCVVGDNAVAFAAACPEERGAQTTVGCVALGDGPPPPPAGDALGPPGGICPDGMPWMGPGQPCADAGPPPPPADDAFGPPGGMCPDGTPWMGPGMPCADAGPPPPPAGDDCPGGEPRTNGMCPPPPRAIPGPPAHVQVTRCKDCMKRGQPFGFCGVTLQCEIGRPGSDRTEENCPHGRGAASEAQCDALAAPPPPAAPHAPPPQALPMAAPPPPGPPVGHFTYENPAEWRTVQGAGQCGGGRQSPIDVNRHVHIPRAGADVQAQYQPTRLTALVNNGHSLQVDGQFGVLTTPRGTYTAQQLHFHFPSEHTLDGVNADGEMHIVHTLNSDPRFYVVIAVMLKVGRPLSYQFDALHAIGLYNYPDSSRLKEGERKTLTSTLNLADALKPQLKGDFFSYDGSLTTPPCTETVAWLVSATPMNVGWRMPTDFNLEFGKFGNNRPTQPMNNRPLKVKRFLPAGQPFVPQPDPNEENRDGLPPLVAPPQADDNSDILTGADAQATADDEDSDCDPIMWCSIMGKDGTPLMNNFGEFIILSLDIAEAKAKCEGNEDCVGLGQLRGKWIGFSDLDGNGDINGFLKPTEVMTNEEDEDEEDGAPVPVFGR